MKTRREVTALLKRLIWDAGGVKEFARKTGVSVYTAENWYCGRTVPTGAPTICKLIKYTGMKPHEFLTEREP